MIQSEVLLYFMGFLIGLCDYKEAIGNDDDNPPINCAFLTEETVVYCKLPPVAAPLSVVQYLCRVIGHSYHVQRIKQTCYQNTSQFIAHLKPMYKFCFIIFCKN